MPLTLEELKPAVNKGGRNKAPGRDGIGLEFFKATWGVLKGDMLELFTQMFEGNELSGQQKRRVIVCIPKRAKPTHPTHFRPIMLKNTDYKIVARIVAGRLRPALGEILHPNKYCGVPGKTIFDSVAILRDAIAYAEVAHTPLCVLSLDFKEAFDRISHTYLVTILQRYGFSEVFIERI
jgi:hypothetical protein